MKLCQRSKHKTWYASFECCKRFPAVKRLSLKTKGKKEALATACNIKAHFHNLRHTAATYMIKNSIPLEIIQKILGHSDIRTTQIYAQVYDDVIQKEMSKLKY